MRRVAAGLVVAVMTVVLVACGGGGSKTKTTVAAGTAGSSGGSGSSATTSGSSGNSGSSSPNYTWCNNGATNNLIQQMQASAASAAGGSDVLQKNLNLLKTYANNAPSAIKGDVNTLVTFYAKFVTILTNDKSDPAKLGTDMQGIQADEASLKAASDHIGAWAAANCHA